MDLCLYCLFSISCAMCRDHTRTTESENCESLKEYNVLPNSVLPLANVECDSSIAVLWSKMKAVAVSLTTWSRASQLYCVCTVHCVFFHSIQPQSGDTKYVPVHPVICQWWPFQYLCSSPIITNTSVHKPSCCYHHSVQHPLQCTMRILSSSNSSGLFVLGHILKNP